MANPKERRISPRRRTHYKIRFWNAALDATGFVTDVSDVGLFIETRKLPAVGTRLHLEVHLTEEPFLVEGEVARLQQVGNSVAGLRGNGIGVRLITWPEAFELGRAGQPLRMAMAAGMGTQADPLRYDLRDPKTLASVFAKELCRGGLFVPTKVGLALGTRAHVLLVLPPPHGELGGVGDVVYANDSPAGVGLALLDVLNLRGQLSAILGQLNV